jgi:hypothetical protein
MDEATPYNPLDKTHLADSIAREFFKQDLQPLPPEPFTGAGIYAIYYRGDFPLYAKIAGSLRAYEAARRRSTWQPGVKQPKPIYIGKSEPPGSRKGLFAGVMEESGEEAVVQEAEELLTEKPRHRKLYSRLFKHSKSIATATNLQLGDFRCRYMLVDEIWVPLGEARLVASFKPVWNVLIEGFGSNPEGGGRKDTARSVWDILHPGRKEELAIQVGPDIEENVVGALRTANDLKALATAIAAHREAKIRFAKVRKAAAKTKPKPESGD